MNFGEVVSKEMTNAKNEEGITYEELSNRMGMVEKQHSQGQITRYTKGQGSIETIEKMASALNRKIIFKLVKGGDEDLKENEEYFIDRSLQKYGGKTIITFKSDGYQVFIDAMHLTDEEYIERATKIKSLTREEQ